MILFYFGASFDDEWLFLVKINNGQHIFSWNRPIIFYTYLILFFFKICQNLPFSQCSFALERTIYGHMLSSWAPTFYMDVADGSSLRLRFAFFEHLQKGGAFSFDNLNHSFCRILDLVQDRGVFNSYDESWFIRQSLLWHMDVLLPIALWCDVSPKDSSMVEVGLPHNSLKPYKVFKISFKLSPCWLQIATIVGIVHSKLKLSFCFVMW